MDTDDKISVNYFFNRLVLFTRPCVARAVMKTAFLLCGGELTKLVELASTNIHVRIFERSYSDTSWEFTREIKEENFKF